MSLLPQHFHFLAPQWLWALLLLPLVLAAIWWQQRDGNFARLADSQLLPLLLTGKAKRRLLPLLLAGLVWCLGCVALAGPSWQQQPLPLMQSQAAQVIALSLSNTMYANDTPPSRLERARFKVSDLLAANKAGLNALVGFAGAAFVVAPLTRDAHSLSALLAAMNQSTMPVDGHQASAAIDKSVQLLQQAGERRGLILLLTDSADANALDAARQAKQVGFTVSVLGIGANDKKPVTLPDGSLLHDDAGNLVLSQRDDARLAAIAHAGGGRYLIASNNRADVQTLEQDLRHDGQRQLKRQVDRWVDAGPWLLLPLLALLALLFRRGWLLLLLLMPFAFPQPAQAADWQQQLQQGWHNLWLRPDQQAARAIANGQPTQAEQLAKDPDWKGAGAYQANHFQAAADAYQNSHSPDASYNLGNAQARLGDYDAAIASYEKALKQNPNNSDAQANLDLLKKRQQQQQKQDNKNGKDSQKQNGKQGDQSGSQGEQKQSQQDNKSDSQHSANSHAKNGDEQHNKQPNNPQPNNPQNSQSQSGSKSDAQEQPTPNKSQAQQQAEQQATEQAKQALSKQMDKALNHAKPEQAEQAKAEPPQVNDLGQASAAKDALQQLPAGTRQLLESVPDDPGALLRRKFQLEYQQRHSGEQP